jgi:uncharacterized protein YndB with AHSA1/START domain
MFSQSAKPTTMEVNVMSKAAAEDFLISIDQTLEIKAAPGTVFEGLMQHMCRLEGEDGSPPVILKLERWPGGRWFRDLEGGTGHLWGFVQSIKPPSLLEIFGPMFMSNPVAGHLIVRLSPITGGTKLVFKNDVFGVLPPEMKEGMTEGWNDMLTRIKRDAEK